MASSQAPDMFSESDLTREEWIATAWGDDVPDPWLPEHELQLPEHLQDFEQIEGEII